MNSLFDTLVRNRRINTPWARMSASAFMNEMAWNGAPKKPGDPATPVSISVVHRPDVVTRMWYTVSWPSEKGEVLEASAQELELALWRAAHMEIDRRKLREGDEPPHMPPPQISGPTGEVGPS